MTYTVTSDIFVKPLGEQITEEELNALGANIPALVEGGHLSEVAPTKTKSEGVANG